MSESRTACPRDVMGGGHGVRIRCPTDGLAEAPGQAHSQSVSLDSRITDAAGPLKEDLKRT